MPWFKVDDQMHSHPKMRGLDMASRGLWVTAGSWCASYLTDGEITEREVKALGGTRRQAEKLVAAGLWRLVDDAPGARRYAFHDWAEFQPTRADVSAKRQEARDRMAAARAKKRENSENAEMFARTDRERSREVRSDRSTERSPYPDPTRPDPTNSGSTSQPSTSSKGDADWLAGNSLLDELAAATQRAREAGISETAITEGTRRFQNRTGDKGPGLLRLMIEDAWAEEQAATQANNTRAQRRATIDACNRCDDNGWRIGTNPAVKCTHQPPLKAVGGPF